MLLPRELGGDLHPCRVEVADVDDLRELWSDQGEVRDCLEDLGSDTPGQPPKQRAFRSGRDTPWREVSCTFPRYRTVTETALCSSALLARSHFLPRPSEADHRRKQRYWVRST